LGHDRCSIGGMEHGGMGHDAWEAPPRLLAWPCEDAFIGHRGSSMAPGRTDPPWRHAGRSNGCSIHHTHPPWLHASSHGHASILHTQPPPCVPSSHGHGAAPFRPAPCPIGQIWRIWEERLAGGTRKQVPAPPSSPSLTRKQAAATAGGEEAKECGHAARVTWRTQHVSRGARSTCHVAHGP
jgi:hypothetical protein